MKVTGTIDIKGTLPLGVDAKAIAEAALQALAEHSRGSIERSTDPETGKPKPPIAERTARVKGRKGGRGYRTGRLAAGLGERTTGGFFTASGKLRVPADRVAFVRTEAARGIVYLAVDGQAAAVIDEAVSEEMQRQVGP